MKKSIEELTLLLMYLTAWNEEGYRYNENSNMPEKFTLKSCFKGYNFDVLNTLTDKEYLYPTKNKNKIVTLTSKGEKFAKKLMGKYLK